MIDNLYETLGEEVICNLIAAFYKQIPSDDILGPMYEHTDLAGAETRLREFLIFRLGGPQDYLQHRGHPRLRMRHAPFRVDKAARDRWMQLMTSALDETISPDSERMALQQFLGDVATAMINAE